MPSLRAQLIRLAHMNPSLRPHLLPILASTEKEGMEFPTQEALNKYLKDHPGADKSKHKVKKPKAEEAGAGGAGAAGGAAEPPKPKKPKRISDPEDAGIAIQDLVAPQAMFAAMGGYRPRGVAREVPALRRAKSWKDAKDIVDKAVKDGTITKKEGEAFLDDAQDRAVEIEMDTRDALLDAITDFHNEPGSKNWSARKVQMHLTGEIERSMRDDHGVAEYLRDMSETDFRDFVESMRPPSYKKNYPKAVAEVMDDHDLTDDDAAEVKKFKKGKPSSGVSVSDAELMRRFMAKAKPETKERMKDMTPAEFKAMLAAISEEEEG